MIIHKACNQFIVGLKSVHPILRMIKESNFRHVSLVIEQKNYSKYYHEIIKCLRRNNIIWDQIYINRESQHIAFDIEIDLIISCGKNFVHNAARIGNVHNAQHYCLQTVSGVMSSYGTDINWFTKKTLAAPAIIFNDCAKFHAWSTLDIAYLLHNIPLALTACIESKQDTFIMVNAIAGVVNLLKSMHTILLGHQRYSKHLFNEKIAYADILLKTAYNNVTCPSFVTALMQHCDNLAALELALALLSTKIFKRLMTQHNEEIAKALIVADCSMDKLQQLFGDVYQIFIKQYENDEMTKKILNPACLQAIKDFEQGGA